MWKLQHSCVDAGDDWGKRLRARNDEQSRERIFDELLSSLNSADPLESVLSRVARICSGAGLAVNELGEVIRAVGSAPSHLISQWVRDDVMSGEATSPGEIEIVHGKIGRWLVGARIVRLRGRDHAIVVAVHEDTEAVGRPKSDYSEADLVLDTVSKLLRAFEGFESFTISNRKEESARLLRDLEAGVSPGRESVMWRALEDFGFVSYEPIRAVRIRTDVEEPGGRRRAPSPGKGMIVKDSGYVSSVIEHTALCLTDFDIVEQFDSDSLIGVGISGPFTALSQVPEMLQTADVALASARDSKFIFVDEMRPIEWAAARMNSRFDRRLVERFLQPISESSEAWATVTTYIRCGAVIAEAAKQLQVHENTVRYRLSQIEKSLGARLSDPRTIAEVVLALRCREADDAVPTDSPRRSGAVR